MRPRSPMPWLLPRSMARSLVAVATAATMAFTAAFAAPLPAGATSVTDLKSQLQALRDRVRASTDRYDAAETTLEDTQYRIKVADAKIRQETSRLDSAQKRLAIRADALYRGGGQSDMLDFLLGAATWEDFVTRLDLVTLVASSDAGLVSDVKATKLRLQAGRRQLAAEARVEAKHVSVTESRKIAMEGDLASRKADYDRVLGEVAAQYAREHPKAGSSFPPGPNGMVFPVQGIHQYSDTWGAPRSGGRHHMGTDIMSPRGTPVVAVSSGDANPHHNGLGGNSITLSGDNGWSYYYAHLDSYAISGGHVKAGQLIGYVGNTGNAAGGPCHLHFQMGPGGGWVDPYPYLTQME